MLNLTVNKSEQYKSPLEVTRSITHGYDNLQFILIWIITAHYHLNCQNDWLYKTALKRVKITKKNNHHLAPLNLLTFDLVENTPYGRFSNGKSLPSGMFTKLVIVPLCFTTNSLTKLVTELTRRVWKSLNVITQSTKAVAKAKKATCSIASSAATNARLALKCDRD